MKTTLFSVWLTLIFGLAATPMGVIAESGGTSTAAFSQAELDQMMAPVALYPDSLLSQVLMAATYPDQVAQAARWSKANPKQEGDAAVTAVQGKGWDPSVASMVAFPQVLAIMAEKPDWVRQMGDAFLAEPEKVMDAVQNLRQKAKEAGNLESSEQQVVIVEQEPQQTIIKIEPADPQVIYVPAYNPTVIYGTWWWPAYRPFYYYPPGYGFAAGVWTGIAFGIGIGITNSLWGRCNWRSRDVNINVNRYNKINVNNRLNVKNKNVSWKNKNVKRRDKARADLRDRKRPGNKLGGADKRKNFRGRDADRDRARTTLKNKGIDPSAERKKLSGKGGDRVRDQVGKIDRDRKAGADGGKRDQSSPKKRGLSGSSAKRSDRDRKAPAGGGTRDRASPKKRDSSRGSTKRSDNAFKGLGDGNRAGLNAERGRSSNRSFQSHRGGGGSGQRGGGGGGHAGRR